MPATLPPGSSATITGSGQFVPQRGAYDLPPFGEGNARRLVPNYFWRGYPGRLKPKGYPAKGVADHYVQNITTPISFFMATTTGERFVEGELYRSPESAGRPAEYVRHPERDLSKSPAVATTASALTRC